MGEFAEAAEALAGGVEGLLALGEMEADEIVNGLAEEAGAGHAGDAHFADEPFGGFGVAGFGLGLGVAGVWVRGVGCVEGGDTVAGSAISVSISSLPERPAAACTAFRGRSRSSA